jgi:hypothetical protein
MREYKKFSLQLPEGWDFPAISVVTGRDLPAITFLARRIVKNFMGGWQIVLVSTAGFSVQNKGIFGWEAKKMCFFTV